MFTNSLSFTRLGDIWSLYCVAEGGRAWDSEVNLNFSSISVSSCLALGLQLPPLQSNHLVGL